MPEPLCLNPFSIRSAFKRNPCPSLGRDKSLNPFSIRSAFKRDKAMSHNMVTCLNPFSIRSAFKRGDPGFIVFPPQS